MSAHEANSVDQRQERRTFDAALARLARRVKLIQSRTEALRIHQQLADSAEEEHHDLGPHLEYG
jgi:hypothetical protein